MSEKTEKPTPKKIRDARKKGEVAHSKDIVTAALLIATYGLLFGFGYVMMSEMLELLALPTYFYDIPFEEALKETVNGALEKSIDIVMPFIILVIFTVIFSNVVQIGPLFATESIKPDIKKVNPIEGFKKIFSMKNVVELIKSIIKIVFLTILVYYVIISNLKDLLYLPYCGKACLTPVFGELMFQFALISAIAFIIVGFADIGYQKYDHQKKLRMTKDEVKREYKDIEGDPEISQERKRIHKEMLEDRVKDNVKNASVIVTNPTHFAIGIFYDGDTRTLPVVTIKAKNRQAQRIKRLAQEYGIPLMENMPLARALYADAELDNYIPSELIEPVAEVLKWVAENSVDRA